MPYNPYFETDDLLEAIKKTDELSLKHQVTVYVVDRMPQTMFQEIYVHISKDFKHTPRH